MSDYHDFLQDVVRMCLGQRHGGQQFVSFHNLRRTSRPKWVGRSYGATGEELASSSVVQLMDVSSDDQS
jgi:hypothetical protein